MLFFFFYKIWAQEGGTGPVWGLTSVGGGRGGERVSEGEYSANTVFTCM
jgi:hypothetical protein